MNLINHKNGENLAFMRSLQFLPNFKLLENQKIRVFTTEIFFSKNVFVKTSCYIFKIVIKK